MSNSPTVVVSAALAYPVGASPSIDTRYRSSLRSHSTIGRPSGLLARKRRVAPGRLCERQRPSWSSSAFSD